MPNYSRDNLPLDGGKVYRVRNKVTAYLAAEDCTVSTPFGALPCKSGDYIVVSNDGNLAPLPAIEFEKLFELDEDN